MDEWSAESTVDLNTPLDESQAPERLRTIYAIGRALVEQHEPKDVLDTIFGALVEHLRPDRAACFTVESSEIFRPVSTYELELGENDDDWPISRTALRIATRKKIGVLAKDPLGESPLKSAGSIQKFQIRSVLSVPLGPDGVLYADRRARRSSFDVADLRFMTAIAAYAAPILRKAREYASTSSALERSSERLAVLETELMRHELVGKSAGLIQAYKTLKRMAEAGASVLLRGETGTGKDLFARAYVSHCPRRVSGYVPVPIPALSPTLVESELFGHVKGAFTQAAQKKKGRLEVAHHGVVFLDEVGDIDLALQAKLLRFLDSGELYRVGGTEPMFIDTLVVSATNRPLETLVDRGLFRADLLARLGHVVEIPPLRERREDIPLLAEHFASQFSHGRKRKTFSDAAMKALERYRWEFNVRQLQQVVERVSVMVDADVVRKRDLPEFVSRATPDEEPDRDEAVGAREENRPPAPLKNIVEQAEREHIKFALEFTKGNRKRAIELLEVSTDTFYRRLDHFGLREPK